ncbi:hypothetical protein EON63_03355 [archaeon]|nr:MAG: hypothetical protein EON63_03355 [archaeon]
MSAAVHQNNSNLKKRKRRTVEAVDNIRYLVCVSVYLTVLYCVYVCISYVYVSVDTHVFFFSINRRRLSESLEDGTDADTE